MTDDIDTTRTYTAAELGHIFGVSARWVGRCCAHGKTLRGYRLRRWREHSNQPYTYEVGLARAGEEPETGYSVRSSSEHVERVMPV